MALTGGIPYLPPSSAVLMKNHFAAHSWECCFRCRVGKEELRNRGARVMVYAVDALQLAVAQAKTARRRNKRLENTRRNVMSVY